MNESDVRRLKLGHRVVAVTQIVEGDIDIVGSARPCDPGWLHALPGALGTVVSIDKIVEMEGGHMVFGRPGIGITVRFDNSGTSTLVLPHEVQSLN